MFLLLNPIRPLLSPSLLLLRQFLSSHSIPLSPAIEAIIDSARWRLQAVVASSDVTRHSLATALASAASLAMQQHAAQQGLSSTTADAADGAPAAAAPLSDAAGLEAMLSGLLVKSLDPSALIFQKVQAAVSSALCWLVLLGGKGSGREGGRAVQAAQAALRKVGAACLLEERPGGAGVAGGGMVTEGLLALSRRLRVMVDVGMAVHEPLLRVLMVV